MWAAASTFPVTRPSRVPPSISSGQRLLDPRHHPVAVGLADRVVEVVEIAGDHPGPLRGRRLTPDHLLEDHLGDLGVGHPGVGVLGDVGVDPVLLAEGPLPGGGPRSAGDQDGAVDVEEDRGGHTDG